MLLTRLLLALLLPVIRSVVSIKERDDHEKEHLSAKDDVSKNLIIDTKVNVEEGEKDLRSETTRAVSNDIIQELRRKFRAGKHSEQLSENARILSRSTLKGEYDRPDKEKKSQERVTRSAMKTKAAFKHMESYSEDLKDKAKDKSGQRRLNENPHPPGAETNEENYEQEEDEFKAPKRNDNDPFDLNRFEAHDYSAEGEGSSEGLSFSSANRNQPSAVHNENENGDFISKHGLKHAYSHSLDDSEDDKDADNDTDESGDDEEGAGRGLKKGVVKFPDDISTKRLSRKEYMPEDFCYGLQETEQEVMPQHSALGARLTPGEIFQATQGFISYAELSNQGYDIGNHEAHVDFSVPDADEEVSGAFHPFSNGEGRSSSQMIQYNNLHTNFYYPDKGAKETEAQAESEGYLRGVAEEAEEASGSADAVEESGSGRNEVSCRHQVESDDSESSTGRRCMDYDQEAKHEHQTTWFNAGKLASELDRKARTKSRKHKHTYADDIYISKKKTLATYVLNRGQVAFDRRDSRLIPHPDIFLEPRSKVGENKTVLVSTINDRQVSKKSSSISGEIVPRRLLRQSTFSVDSKAYPRTIHASGNVAMKDVLHRKKLGSLLKREYGEGDSSYAQPHAIKTVHNEELSTRLDRKAILKGSTSVLTLLGNKTMAYQSRYDEQEKHLPAYKRVFFPPESDGVTPMDHINSYEVENLYKHGSDAFVHMMPMDRDITTPPGGLSNPEDDIYDRRGATIWSSFETDLPIADEEAITNEGLFKDKEKVKQFHSSSQFKPHWMNGHRTGNGHAVNDKVDSDDHGQGNDMEANHRLRENAEVRDERRKEAEDEEVRLSDSRKSPNEEPEDHHEYQGRFEGRRKEDERYSETEHDDSDDARENEQMEYSDNSDRRIYNAHSASTHGVAGERGTDFYREDNIFKRPKVDLRNNEPDSRVQSMEIARIESEVKSREAESRFREMETMRMQSELQSRELALEHHQPTALKAEGGVGRALGRPKLGALMQSMQSGIVAAPAVPSSTANTANQAQMKSQLLVGSATLATGTAGPVASLYQEESRPSAALQKLSASVLPRKMITQKRSKTVGEYGIEKYSKNSTKRSLYNRAPGNLVLASIKPATEHDGYKRSLKANIRAHLGAPSTIIDVLRKQFSEEDMFLSKRQSDIFPTPKKSGDQLLSDADSQENIYM